MLRGERRRHHATIGTWEAPNYQPFEWEQCSRLEGEKSLIKHRQVGALRKLEPLQKFTLALSLLLLSWWGPTAHRCRHPRRRAAPGRWVPRCETLRRPRGLCAALPGLQFVLRKKKKKRKNWSQNWSHSYMQTSGLDKPVGKAIQKVCWCSI